MSQERNESVTLDGSCLDEFASAFAQRLKGMLDRVISAKEGGIGVYARPEADVSLMRLLCILHQLEPEQGWLQSAAITLAWTLDDALRRAPEIWWGPDWMHPYEREYPLKWKMLAELRGPTLQRRGPTEKDRLLYDIVLDRLSQARRFMPGTNRKAETPKPVELDPIPQDLGQPLWRNRNFRPLEIRKKMFTIGDTVLRGLWIDAHTWTHAFSLAASYLGSVPLPREGTRTQYFFLTSALSQWHRNLLSAPILDRVMGMDGHELLEACMALSGVIRQELLWAEGPSYGHVGRWDSALFSVLVNDRRTLEPWSRRVGQRQAGFPRATLVCDELLCCWIDGKPIPADLKLPKSADRMEIGFAEAVHGLIDRDAGRVEAGVSEMLDGYGRGDYRDIWGQWFSDLCLQAVAVQRAAIRIGMDIQIPEGRPNDPELVRLPDPEFARLPWCPLPGIEVLATSTELLQWPTLLLGRPVRKVNESKSGALPSVH